MQFERHFCMKWNLHYIARRRITYFKNVLISRLPKLSINPINANIVLKRIFNGKLADMFSDALNKKFLGKVSIPRTSRTHITRKCSANAGTNFLKRNLNFYELVESPLNQSVN